MIEIVSFDLFALRILIALEVLPYIFGRRPCTLLARA